MSQHPLKLSPSILTADFGNLAAEIRAAEEGGADYIHLDIMDGRFVPNITFGPMVVKAVRAATRLPLDVHLMIEEPDRYLADFAEAGANILTVQVEACLHLGVGHRRLVDGGTVFLEARPHGQGLRVDGGIDVRAALRRQLADVEPASLARPDQLAYWINLYNVSIVALVVDHYPIESIRDLSTDPLVRLNVFKKPHVLVQGGTISLDEVEHERIRAAFRDARIHFAVNCAAESCPPIREEPYVGARVDEQLADQTRRFLSGPRGARLSERDGVVTVRVSKVMDWFAEDFARWPGGAVGFLKSHLPPAQARRLAAAREVELEFDDYSWKLNDASR